MLKYSFIYIYIYIYRYVILYLENVVMFSLSLWIIKFTVLYRVIKDTK
jgi:hypothetical protein